MNRPAIGNLSKRNITKPTSAFSEIVTSLIRTVLGIVNTFSPTFAVAIAIALFPHMGSASSLEISFDSSISCDIFGHDSKLHYRADTTELAISDSSTVQTFVARGEIQEFAQPLNHCVREKKLSETAFSVSFRCAKIGTIELAIERADGSGSLKVDDLRTSVAPAESKDKNLYVVSCKAENLDATEKPSTESGLARFEPADMPRPN